ncbi:protease [Reyranella sp.]|uniref:protease n=1 Tax=Reyranella sp. TaxID=1929291 RepID=UPI003BA9F716
MIELLLLLVGARVLRRKWWILFLLGTAWFLLGLFFFLDAFTDDRIPPTWFAVPLLIDAAIALAAAAQTAGTERALRIAKAVLFVAIALVLVESPWHVDMIVGILAGTFLLADAAWRATSAWVVRFARWRLSLVGAGLELLWAIASFQPYPTNWAGETGADVGLLLMVSAVGLGGLAIRLRQLPVGLPLSAVLASGWPREEDEAGPATAATRLSRTPGPVTVHVWTPTGALAPVGVRRYVAAFDEKGSVSTGHAALEAPPDIYISHYPATEISLDQPLTRTLRATPDNDVAGLFQPSYEEEARDWCPSTRQVRLRGLDIAAMRAFWRAYRRDTTYNLTSRNCSSGVAKALDAGLEGMFEARAGSPYFLARLLFSPELWVAGVMRRRAAAMAWTPGMVLDYSRALKHIIALPDRLRAGRRPEIRA